MSVLKRNRKPSISQYEYTAYETAKECTKDIAKCPQKYKSTLGAKLFHSCLDMLDETIRADSIKVSDKTPEHIYQIRQQHLVNARACAWNIIAFSKLYFELLAENKTIDKNKSLKKIMYYAKQGGKEIELINDRLKKDQLLLKK